MNLILRTYKILSLYQADNENTKYNPYLKGNNVFFIASKNLQTQQGQDGHHEGEGPVEGAVQEQGHEAV